MPSVWRVFGLVSSSELGTQDGDKGDYTDFCLHLRCLEGHMIGGAQEAAGVQDSEEGGRGECECHLWTRGWDVTKVCGGVNRSAGHDADMSSEESTGLVALSGLWLLA